MDTKYWINSVINSLGWPLDTKHFGSCYLGTLLHTLTLRGAWADCQVSFSLLFNSCPFSLLRLHSKSKVVRYGKKRASSGTIIHLLIPQRWFWVHDELRQDTWAVLYHHTSSHDADISTYLSSTCHILNIEMTWSSGRDLLYTRNGFHTSSSKECLRSGNVSGREV